MLVSVTRKFVSEVACPADSFTSTRIPQLQSLQGSEQGPPTDREPGSQLTYRLTLLIEAQKSLLLGRVHAGVHPFAQ